jgi:hypothetical protein
MNIPIYLPARDPRSAEAEAEWTAAVGGKWKPGRSAHALAIAWFGRRGFPDEVARVFSSTPLAGLSPFLGLVEYQVTLAGRGPASHNDLLVLAKAPNDDLVVIAVEAKVDETFGNDDTVEEWLAAGGENREARISFLAETLVIPEAGLLDPVRYQLVHRAASAVLEARKFNARHAAMLVHSFGHAPALLEQYKAFATTLGAKNPDANVLSRAGDTHGVNLWLGWASGPSSGALV